MIPHQLFKCGRGCLFTVQSLIFIICFKIVQQVHEMLKKGWDAEGSPFKGQDFDPKMFNISPGAIDK